MHVNQRVCVWGDYVSTKISVNKSVIYCCVDWNLCN